MNNFTTLDFSPDRKLSIKNEFRFWQVENLLNQSADLIDQCLRDLKELKQLEVYEFSINQEIAIRQKELNIEKSKKNYERQVLFTTKDVECIEAVNQQLNSVSEAASKVWDETHGWVNVQNAREAATNQTDGIKKKEKAIMLNEWAKEDKNLDLDLLNFKELQLNDKINEQKGDKALNYTLQKQFCLDRLLRNFKDYFERTIIIEEGLKKIYGINNPIVETIQNSSSDIDKINIAYSWTYDRISDLRKYFQLDQTFTSTISLKEIIGNERFKSLKSAKDFYATEFVLTKELFPISSHDNLRFRGIGASLLGGVGKMPWTLKIKLPEKAIFIRMTNEFPIEQNATQYCILGRVENRESLRNMEICGAVSLYNCSPISHEKSTWSIIIEKPSAETELFDNIEDIIIELELTGKSQ